MKRIFFIIGVFLSLLLTTANSKAGEPVHHDLRVAIQPQEHRLKARDEITVPDDLLPEFTFTLHRGLAPSSPTPGVGIERQRGNAAGPLTESFRVILPKGENRFVLEYGGCIHHPLKKKDRNYARGFSGTPGTVSEDGVHLSGHSVWYPHLGTDWVTFTLQVKSPGNWEAVSQGARSVHLRGEDGTSVRWESPEPQEEIYLLAAPFTEYSRTSNSVEAMVFLRQADGALAARYLDATASYLGMYEELIGPYPYDKFALVENFWETGWGMPSFTLLGPKVIRFPFILHTSYPHEILHNWWGNGVYPDYSGGNWSEGLTAYLADHLIKEQRGEGAEYRRASLQKYLDYVSKEADFPLARFRSRHSSSSEAIGYGKALMFFHMLRGQLGDEGFAGGLRTFYRKHKFRKASFTDLRRSFEEVSGLELDEEFAQWVDRPGAPKLRVAGARTEERGGEHLLTLLLEQLQPGEAFKLSIPFAVTLEGEEEAQQGVVPMEGKRGEVEFSLPARPLRIDVDPEFDLFRKLDRREVPPTLSQAFGADRLLVILPSPADEAMLQGYVSLARALSTFGPGAVEVRLDTEVESLPSDRAVAILGWENRFLPQVSAALAGYDASIGPDGVLINGKNIGRGSRSVVLSARNPKNRDLSFLWIGTDLPEALPGLGRKLPHYHKYSYLGFEGGEPTNILKGRWPVRHSPMTVFLSGDLPKVDMGRLAARTPLATLPPAFSREKKGNVR